MRARRSCEVRIGWVKVALFLTIGLPGASGAAQTTNGFYTVTPCRVADTRGTAGPWGGPALSANTSRNFQITGRCGIPTTAEAVVFNVTATGATAGGSLRIYPASGSLPLASAVNYVPGITRASNGSYALSSSGAVSIRCDQASGSVNLILDISGYFETVALPTPSPTPTPTPTPPPGTGGAHVWSKDFGGPGGIDSAKAVGIGVDSSGSSIVFGQLIGKADFGGGLLTSAGGGDMYLVKSSATGGHVWSKRFGGTLDDVPKSVTVDAAGNVAVTGFFRGTVDFGGGALTTAGVAGFVAKYSSSGAHLWSRRLTTGQTTDEGTAIAADAGGNLVVAAGFYGTVNFGGGSLTSAGSEDIALIKYDSSGNFLWARRMGGASDEMVMAIAVDSTTSEIVTAGYFAGSSDVGGGTIRSVGGTDAFVARYSSSGTYTWARNWGNTAEDRAYGVDVDGLGSVAVTGMFTNSLDFGGGPIANVGGNSSGDIFLVKLSSAGVHLWSKGFGSAGVNQTGHGVAFDSAGDVVMTGTLVALSSSYTVDLGGGPFTGDGYSNPFIAKYSANGAHIWSKRYLAGGAHGFGISVATDAGRNVLGTGYYDANINFGGTTLQSPGGTDTYLVKLGP